jgi:MFS family permease
MSLPTINKVIRYLVISDLFLFMGWGLVSPIFSVFIIQEIVGATLVTVGIGAAIYWLARSAIQVPTALLLDRVRGEKDDFYALVSGLVLVAVSSFLLAVIKTPAQLYLIQALYGGSFGVYSVAWPAIFSRHTERGKVAFDWSIDRASVNLVIAVTSFLGAKTAEVFGFSTVFVVAGFVSLASAAVLIAVPQIILPKPTVRYVGTASAGLHHKHKQRGPTGI